MSTFNFAPICNRQGDVPPLGEKRYNGIWLLLEVYIRGAHAQDKIILVGGPNSDPSKLNTD